MKQNVYNLIIIDESGSMYNIKDEAIGGVNETIQVIMSAQRLHSEQQHFITLVTFNDERIHKVMDRLPVDVAKDLSWNDYAPNGLTPLFDAMGQSLNELKGYVKKEDAVLVTIITDGMENASREYDGATIKKLVAELRECGWVITYIGTNQDVDAVADSIGINNRMSYEYSQEGASDMFETENECRMAFYGMLEEKKASPSMNSNVDYFGNRQTDDNKTRKKRNLLDKLKRMFN